MSPGIGSGNIMRVSTRRTRPIVPASRISRRRRASGWYRQWNASITTSPVRSATAATASASAAFAVNGFSQSTCFPASSAAIVQCPCRPFGSGL